jgi:hypothetical protein
MTRLSVFICVYPWLMNSAAWGVEIGRQLIPTDCIDRLRKMYQAQGPKPSNTQYGWIAAEA